MPIHIKLADGFTGELGPRPTVTITRCLREVLVAEHNWTPAPMKSLGTTMIRRALGWVKVGVGLSR